MILHKLCNESIPLIFFFYISSSGTDSMFVQCYQGWYGIDCSIPSIMSTLKEWPRWLRPAVIDLPSKLHVDNPLINVDDPLININAEVKKQRPLIYVYDLPPEFNSHLLEVSKLSIFADYLIMLLVNIFCLFEYPIIVGATLQV